MNEQGVAAFIRNLVHLNNSLRLAAHTEYVSLGRSERVSRGRASFHLSKATERPFFAMVKKLRTTLLLKRFSERSLRDEVLDAIAASLDGDSPEQYVRAMIARLENSVLRTSVLVPLSGILLGSGVSFDFGRVGLVQMNEDRFASTIAPSVSSLVETGYPENLMRALKAVVHVIQRRCASEGDATNIRR